MTLDRRRLIAALPGLVAGLAALRAGAREEPVTLDWEDLIPEAERDDPNRIKETLGIVEHFSGDPMPQQSGAQMVRDYDGRLVRLPGFIVPLDFSGVNVTDFLLVPYVGACIHVPPPPANQIVLVQAAEPLESAGLFDAVWAEGRIGVSTIETDLAEVGYVMTEARTEPYT